MAGCGVAGLADGPARDACFDTPAGLAALPDGSVVVADTGNDVLRRPMTLPQAGKVPVILTFGDWREVDGVKFPFAIDEERNSFPPQTFAIYTERIELNPPVGDGVFAMPR